MINVLVAWACTLRIDVLSAEPRFVSSDSPQLWSGAARSTAGAAIYVSIWGLRHDPSDDADSATFVPSWAGAHKPSIRRTSNLHVDARVVDARGWPIVSLWREQELTDFRINRVILSWAGLQRSALLTLVPSNLPLRPIPHGFTIDSLFYAACLWVVVTIPVTVRRRLRVRHRLCPACGYPAGTSAVCTECGANLPAKLLAKADR